MANNHRSYISDQSPEMTREYEWPLTRSQGVATASPPKQGKAKTGSEQKIRSTR